MTASRFFSADYAQARGKFLDAAAAAGLRVASFANPAKGPRGEALFTDVVRAGEEEAENLFIACSATHGVEGFCGSGAFVGFLEEGMTREVPAGTAVVLVHAINPHGFAHERRVNEDNVDLNRNFVDHDAPHPTSPDYDEIHAMLVPADWDGPARAAADAAIADTMAARGERAFQATVSGGQYDHPDGLFYGGKRPTWSNHTWRRILVEHAGGRRRVGFVDFHTGLGPRGYGELIHLGGQDDPVYRRACDWYGDQVTSTTDGTSVSAVIQGYLANAVDDAAPDAERTSIGLEYGTLPVGDILQALRADNWLYLHGTVDSAQGREIKAEIRTAFYGEDEAWKEDIWARAVEVYRKTLAGLSEG